MKRGGVTRRAHEMLMGGELEYTDVKAEGAVLGDDGHITYRKITGKVLFNAIAITVIEGGMRVEFLQKGESIYCVEVPHKERAATLTLVGLEGALNMVIR